MSDEKRLHRVLCDQHLVDVEALNWATELPSYRYNWQALAVRDDDPRLRTTRGQRIDAFEDDDGVRVQATSFLALVTHISRTNGDALSGQTFVLFHTNGTVGTMKISPKMALISLEHPVRWLGVTIATGEHTMFDLTQLRINEPPYSMRAVEVAMQLDLAFADSLAHHLIDLSATHAFAHRPITNYAYGLRTQLAMIQLLREFTKEANDITAPVSHT